MLWNRSLVMYDVETGTLWSHILGQAMQGELKGATLQMLPSEITTWRAWVGGHPGTSVLNLPRTRQEYTKDFYKDPVSFVWGWAVGRRRFHFPLDALSKNPLMNLGTGNEALLVTFDASSAALQMFSRKLDDRVLSFQPVGDQRIRDEDTGSEWSALTGQAIKGSLKGKRLERRLGMLSYRKAWLVFYPSSQEVVQSK
jgi:hypothetical protein